MNERRPNRLAGETSPYLLQHADNPVDWYPWGPEALERARAEDKPILLSIGYAACHWCHVMERESFEDPEIARLMNESFISIKVDREERPEIDAIYMDAVQALTGHGGWPMTVFLTPEGIPFFGGTYFPPEDRHGLPSFRSVLEGVSQAWIKSRSQIEAEGRKLAEHLQALSNLPPSGEILSSSLIATALGAAARSFDDRNGGFGGPPKFPQAPLLELLLRGARRDEAVLKMVDLTLERMALGGIYDQLGGGFHRYSVDGAWTVPHFEKMLYDNAQLARVYTHAWQLSKKPLLERVAVETLEYLLRDMRDSGGCFYSSEDADSEGVEGKFYVWSREELEGVAPEASGYYGVTGDGNFEGTNILTAASEIPPKPARARLLEARTSRVRPGRDEKILTSWNGLAIGALAEAGAAFGRADFLEAAGRAASFILENLRTGGRLMHSYKDGRASVLGLLEDYAYLADGLLALWEATFEPRWAKECLSLTDQMLELFHDEANGGLFATGHDHERLIVRPKEILESATPSPMGVASLLLQKAGVLTGTKEWATRAGECLRLAHPYLQRAPLGAASFLSALDFWLSTPQEIVIIGPEAPTETALFRLVWQTFLPHRVLAGAPPGIESPMLEGKRPANGVATAFVCENYACRAPTTDPEELAAQLAE